jgi:hypothetical protein
MDFEQSEQTRRLVEITALTGYLKGIEMIEKYRAEIGNQAYHVSKAWRLHGDDCTEVCNITDRLESFAFPLRKAQQKFEVDK